MSEYFNSGLNLKPNLVIPKKKDGISSAELIDQYKKYLENGEIIEITFSRCNIESGNFYKEIATTSENIQIIMPAEESITKASKNQRDSKKLLLDFNVLITEVDENNKVITVSHKQAIKKLKTIVQKTISRELRRPGRDKETEKVIVPAKIVGIYKSKNAVLLDLYGYGLPGYIEPVHWQHLYTKNVERTAVVGSVIDVEVLKYVSEPFGKGSTSMLACSRKNVVKNPWEGIESRYKKNDMVRIHCVSKERNHWFGTIEGLNGIQVFCEYPDASNGVTDIRIVLGKEYEGYIYSVSEEKMLLKARVFREILKN